MMNKAGLGILPRVEITAINRLGVNTAVGGVYALDILQSDGDSTSADLGFGGVVATATGSANTTNMRGFLVVALGIYADNAPGRYVLKGVVDALCDGGSVDIAAGDKLIPVTASTKLLSWATSTLVVPVAIALVAYTSGTIALKKVYFDGENWKTEAAAS